MKTYLYLAFGLSLAAAAHATTINFATNAASGSCFVNTFSDLSSGCQAGGVSLTFTNAQGDSALLSWGGVTNSVGFGTGPLQLVNYGAFSLTYNSNGGDTTPVVIPQRSFALIIKEFSPAVIFYQAIKVDFSGLNSTEGLVGPGSADLAASFSPVTVTNGTDTTFFVSASVTPINLGLNNIAGQIQASAVPEPQTWVLLTAAIPLALVKRRRSREQVRQKL